MTENVYLDTVFIFWSSYPWLLGLNATAGDRSFTGDAQNIVSFIKEREKLKKKKRKKVCVRAEMFFRYLIFSCYGSI